MGGEGEKEIIRAYVQAGNNLIYWLFQIIFFFVVELLRIIK